MSDDTTQDPRQQETSAEELSTSPQPAEEQEQAQAPAEDAPSSEQEPAHAAQEDASSPPEEERGEEAPAPPVAEAEASGEDAPASEAEGEDEGQGEDDSPAPKQRVPNVSRELKRLVDLATKYPEIGAPLAALATRLGYQGISDRLLNMGLEDEARGVEYHIVAANLARKEGRFTDVLDSVLAGLRDFASSGEDAPDIKNRLLHLIRLGFAVVMFDLDDIRDAPEFSTALAEEFPGLRERFEGDAFYLSLLAQALWFTSPEQSEATWAEAVELGEAETTWNARGTWYKEAEKDLARAEGSYRSGLKALPTSVLLMHNLAQVLMDRAAADDARPEQARNWLNEADALLRQAHRRARRHSMRRHINGNIERAKALLNALPKEKRFDEPPPEGTVLRARVNNIKHYGAFLTINRKYTGLLHKSELSHDYVDDPNSVLEVGDVLEVKVIRLEHHEGEDRVRIALSRKALLPKPEGTSSGGDEQKRGGGGGNNRRRRNRRGKRNDGNNRGNNRNNNPRGGRGGGRDDNRRGKNDRDQSGGDQIGSLGELLLAKLAEKKEN